jgi:hypothetical protein
MKSDSRRNSYDTPPALLCPHRNINVLEAEEVAPIPPDIFYNLISTEDGATGRPVIINQVDWVSLITYATIF